MTILVADDDPVIGNLVAKSLEQDMVRSLSADWVVDYTREAFTRSGERYDPAVYCVGNRSLLNIGVS